MQNINVTNHMIDENDLPNGTLVYDPSDAEVLLSDPNEIYDNVIKIYQHMLSESMIALKATDLKAFEEYMEQQYQSFAERYYSTFKMVISGEDIRPLMRMLNEISNIRRGVKSYEEAEKDIGSMLSSIYVAPALQNAEKNKTKKNKRMKK